MRIIHQLLQNRGEPPLCEQLELELGDLEAKHSCLCSAAAQVFFRAQHLGYSQ